MRAAPTCLYFVHSIPALVRCHCAPPFFVLFLHIPRSAIFCSFYVQFYYHAMSLLEVTAYARLSLLEVTAYARLSLLEVTAG
jgi:hypothetical protein